jgi:hypothetical protein
MRHALLFLSVTAAMWGQSMTEAAAAVAGGSIGGAAGKKVSSSIDTIFGKVDDTAKKAASQDKGKAKQTAAVPAIQVGPGRPRVDTVPPPPPPALHPARAPRVSKPQVPVVAAYVPEPVVQPPPAVRPRMTSAELSQVTPGTSREDVLKLGTPAAKITMFDGGHLVEVYRYADKDNSLGSIQLSDGEVSNVIVRR